MNLEKIQEALADATKAKKLYENSDGYEATLDWSFWDGYQTAIKFALFHLDQGDQIDD